MHLILTTLVALTDIPQQGHTYFLLLDVLFGAVPLLEPVFVPPIE